jgi:hypothetical protein
LAGHILGLKDYWKHDAFFDYMDRYMAVTAPDGEHPGSRSLDRFAEYVGRLSQRLRSQLAKQSHFENKC